MHNEGEDRVNKGAKMKKAGLVAGCFLLVGIAARAQNFELPPVTNDTNSIQTAFTRLLENIAQMGFIDYDSSWDNPAKFQRYLDGVLNNMSYAKTKAYVEKISASIQGIDFGNLSKRQQTDFEMFMAQANMYSLFADFQESHYDSSEQREIKNRKRPLWDSLKNFQTWVNFFKNDNTEARDFLVMQKNKDGLYRLLDEIPQREVAAYRQRLGEFCAGWGL
jgi:hypothetical protein